MIYLGLLITFLVGWVLLPPKWETGLGAKASFALATGMAAVSVQMFAYDLAGFGWGPLRLLLPWVVVAGLAVYRHRSGILQPLWPLKKLDVSALDVPLFLVVLIPLAVWVPFERLMPLNAWDAWAIWLYKAKAFFLDGNLDGFFGGHATITAQPGYPLLVPLYATFLYVLAGDAVDYSVKILSPCSFVALLGVFHYFAKRWLGNTPGLAFTAIVACTPMVGSLAFDYAGYAGTTLSLYLVAAAGFLYEWCKDGGLLNLAGVSLAATAAAWTKNEGQFFFVAVMLAAAAGLAFRKKNLGAWALWTVPPLAVLVPWSLLRQSYGIQAAEFTVGVRFRPDLFATSLQAMLAKAFDTDLFILTFASHAGTRPLTRCLSSRLLCGFGRRETVGLATAVLAAASTDLVAPFRGVARLLDGTQRHRVVAGHVSRPNLGSNRASGSAGPCRVGLPLDESGRAPGGGRACGAYHQEGEASAQSTLILGRNGTLHLSGSMVAIDQFRGLRPGRHWPLWNLT